MHGAFRCSGAWVLRVLWASVVLVHCMRVSRCLAQKTVQQTDHDHEKRSGGLQVGVGMGPHAPFSPVEPPQVFPVCGHGFRSEASNSRPGRGIAAKDRDRRSLCEGFEARYRTRRLETESRGDAKVQECATAPLHLAPAESLGEDLDHHATILRAAFLGIVRRNRLFLAVADHIDLVQRNLMLLVEIPLHRFGALHPQLVVDGR